jgi:hypothetical protein
VSAPIRVLEEALVSAPMRVLEEALVSTLPMSTVNTRLDSTRGGPIYRTHHIPACSTP